MLDRHIRPLIDPPLNRLGAWLADHAVSANVVTLTGLGIGLLAAVAIAIGWMTVAIVFILLSRLADGLDGAVARATRKSDFGGYLDITSDFLFYGAIPLAFIWLDPSQNAKAGALLLVSFYFNGASFLGYAILAEKQGQETQAQGVKSLYYSNGLLEGTETIVFFIAICLFPSGFTVLSYLFAGLCFATGALRLYAARQVFT